jgi:hypothetical protein
VTSNDIISSESMNAADRLKAYQAMGEISRKWIAALDTKAAFIVAINGALLGFIWTGAKLVEGPALWARPIAILASMLALASLFLALGVVFPRIALKLKPSVEPISFFAHVAKRYPESDGSKFAEAVLAMSDEDLAREALEQHHAICHVASIKNTLVTHSAMCWIGALVATALAVLVKMT